MRSEQSEGAASAEIEQSTGTHFVRFHTELLPIEQSRSFQILRRKSGRDVAVFESVKFDLHADRLPERGMTSELSGARVRIAIES